LFWIPKNELYLVDFPGYGYARRSKKEQDLWARLVETYLNKNRLQATIVLLDCRHSPQKNDLRLLSYLTHHQVPLIILLTKIDKCTMGRRSQSQRQWREILGHETQLLLFSAKTEYGKEDLWQAIHQVGAR
jgi:GTP-binding protein